MNLKKDNATPEPWLNNIAWGKLAGFLAFAGLLLNQLNMAPMPAHWKPWLVWSGVFITQLGGFLLNPKNKDWVTDEEFAEDAPEPPAAPQLTPKQLDIQRRRAELARLEESE